MPTMSGIRFFISICLRPRYAAPGTNVACTVLVTRDAMPGTDKVYGGVSLRACYAKSGTDVAATRH
eukprot:497632-Rhodomonas_salina.1